MRVADQKNTNFINKQLEALQRNYTLMIGLILLFVCIVIWMLISIVQTEDTSNLTTTAKKYTAQLNPNLDQVTLEKVASKTYYSETDLQDFPIFILIEDKSGNFQVAPLGTTAEEAEAIQNSSSNTTNPSAADEDEEEVESAATATPIPTSTVAPTPTPEATPQ